ncbi:hypothetical protein Scep_014654 [Stephania cephalantha]|uniref:Uncharacterized protein n=1 Tax=Stephania cephalantha TaxID=152367 RepID=A0AAP0J3K0_9MAGN
MKQSIGFASFLTSPFSFFVWRLGTGKLMSYLSLLFSSSLPFIIFNSFSIFV